MTQAAAQAPVWRRLRAAFPSLLIWAPAALMVLYVKFTVLAGGGFLVASREFGYSTEAELSVWQKLSFFREELLVTGLLVPLLLLVCGAFLGRRWRVVVYSAVSGLVSMVLFAQLKTVEAVGRLLSLTLVSDAVHWARQDPQSIEAYLGLRGLLRLGAVLLLTAAVAWWSYRTGPSSFRSGSGRSLTGRAGRVACRIGLASLLVLVAVSFAARVPTTPYHDSLLADTVSSLWESGDVDVSEFSHLPAAELVRRYREIAHATAPERDRRYWARAAGADVLTMVLETAPARALALDGDLRDTPNLKRLRERSFIALQHYTTYPYTSRALFSIFSSWYPSSLMRSFIQQHPHMVLPGLIRSLADNGYDTANYIPIRSRLEPDDDLYRALGFRRVICPEPERSGPPGADADLNSPRARLARDGAAFAILKKDLQQSLASGRRFAYAFMPQIGHGPWADGWPAAKGADVPGRIHAIIGLEDQWIGELMALLDRYHRLERTIIVILGDHGVRTRAEDPDLPAGRIDAYSYHVPLLIYAPQALARTETVSWLTSHIDVAPTVLDLLGVSSGRGLEQGAPLWDASLAGRTTFFFGYHYLGSDGLYQSGRFSMRNQVAQTVYHNARLSFADKDLVPAATPAFQETTRALTRMTALQQVWAARFGIPANQ